MILHNFRLPEYLERGRERERAKPVSRKPIIFEMEFSFNPLEASGGRWVVKGIKQLPVVARGPEVLKHARMNRLQQQVSNSVMIVMRCHNDDPNGHSELVPVCSSHTCRNDDAWSTMTRIRP